MDNTSKLINVKLISSAIVFLSCLKIFVGAITLNEKSFIDFKNDFYFYDLLNKDM